jgi:hypothetical protein
MRVLRRVFRTKRGCNSRLEKTASCGASSFILFGNEY